MRRAWASPEDGVRTLSARDPEAAVERLLQWLSTREHSRGELEQKLLAAGYAADVVASCLDRLADRGLQSDERFVETFVESHLRRGWGPQRIRQGLTQRGVTGEEAARCLDLGPAEWHRLMVAAHDKRFGSALPTTTQERVRRARFLEYRGFEIAEVRRFLWSKHSTDP